MIYFLEERGFPYLLGREGIWAGGKGEGGYTVEPRFNEPLFNEVLDITNDIISMSRPKLQ